MTQTKQFKFRLASIDEIKFFFSSADAVDQDNQIIQSFGITTNIRYDWNIENNAFGVVLDFGYIRPMDNIEVLRFECRINFLIDDLSEHLLIQETTSDFEINENLETTLVSISISTIRGILFQKTRGTVFHSHLLPLMDPKRLLVSKLLKGKKLVE